MNEPIKVDLVFDCKEPLIAKHCDEKFHQDFTDVLERMAPDLESWVCYCNVKLVAEAKLQEWYDYLTDDQGNRHAILNPDGSKKLLVPIVRIEPV